MTQNRIRIIKVGVLVVALVLLVMVVLSHRTLTSFGEASERVLATHEVRDALEEVLAQLRDMETGSRGFLLTGNERFLEPYAQGRETIKQGLARLRELMRDEPGQNLRLERLESLVARKLATMEEGIDLRRQTGIEAAAAYVATTGGKQAMDEIREVVTGMRAEQDQALDIWLEAARKDGRWTVAALVVGLAMDGLLILSIIILIRQDWRARDEAAQAIQRQAGEIHDLYNHAPCGYHSLDANGVFVSVNDTELRWLGHTREELIGRRKFSDLLTTESRALFAENFPRFKRQGAISDLEYELVCKDGTTLPVVLNAVAVYDETGCYVSSRSTLFDNTDRKRIEKLGQQARLHAESIVESVREPLVILTNELRINRANRAFYTTFQTTPADIEGCCFRELAGGAWNQPQLLEKLERVIPQATPFDDYEMTADFPGVGRKVLRLNARKLYRPGNHTTMLLLALEDVTRRRQAEAELDRFFTLSLDFLCISSVDGYFKRVSPAVSDILGWSVEEFLARPYMEHVHPEDHEATRQEVEKQVRSGCKVLSFENRYRHKDGSWRILSWRSVPQPGGLMYATARDVTERREAEARIRQLNTELRQHSAQLTAANKELESFSYSVSHDLRAPLRHIDGFAQLLQKNAGDRLDETGRRHLGVISSSAKNLGLLIDELLQFSRMGRAELRHMQLDMRTLVEEVASVLQGEPQERKIEWRIHALPVVEADPAMLRQVWMNLLGNAVKYSRHQPETCIEVSHRLDGQDGHVFSVRDNGAGFDMRYVGKLFGVFQRLHGPSEFEGTGIGLANVQRIVLRHGGRVWAEGAIGHGATFYFSLPLHDPASIAGAPAPQNHE